MLKIRENKPLDKCQITSDKPVKMSLIVIFSIYFLIQNLFKESIQIILNQFNTIKVCRKKKYVSKQQAKHLFVGKL